MLLSISFVTRTQKLTSDLLNHCFSKKINELTALLLFTLPTARARVKMDAKFNVSLQNYITKSPFF